MIVALDKYSTKGIERSTRAWFFVTVLGQLAFVYYVVAFFGVGGIQTNFETWQKVADGIVSGDELGNISVAAHLFLSVVITIIGPLQLTPYIRNYAPRFHRASGKIYIIIALLISTSGLYMIWGRDTDAAGLMGQISASLNSLFIIFAAIVTLRFASKRQFLAHQVWATRLFLVVSGVWFFRIGLQAWLFMQNDPLWIDMNSFSGPFISFWNFGCYLVPLIIFEFYRYVKNKGQASSKLLLLVTMSACVFITSIGSYAAVRNLWVPRIETLLPDNEHSAQEPGLPLSHLRPGHSSSQEVVG